MRGARCARRGGPGMRGAHHRVAVRDRSVRARTDVRDHGHDVLVRLRAVPRALAVAYYEDSALATAKGADGLATQYAMRRAGGHRADAFCQGDRHGHVGASSQRAHAHPRSPNEVVAGAQCVVVVEGQLHLSSDGGRKVAEGACRIPDGIYSVPFHRPARSLLHVAARRAAQLGSHVHVGRGQDVEAWHVACAHKAHDQRPFVSDLRLLRLAHKDDALARLRGRPSCATTFRPGAADCGLLAGVVDSPHAR